MKKIFIKLFTRAPKTATLNWQKISSVLIRPIGTGIGDAVILSAVCVQLKKAYPNCRIGVLVSARNLPIFQRVREVDLCIKDTWMSYLNYRGKFEVMLDYQPTFTTRTIFADYLLKPTYKICFEKQPKKHYSAQTVHNYNFYVPNLAAAHLSKSLTLTPFAPYIDASHPVYSLDKPTIQQVAHRPSTEALVVVCPFGSDRQINPQELANLLTRLTHQFNVRFICPFAREKYPLPTHLPVTYTGPLALDGFLSAIAQASLCIAADSAAVHIAEAYHTPLVAVYSGWNRNFRLFAPLDASAAVRSGRPANGPVTTLDCWSIDKAVALCAKNLSSFATM